MDLPCKICPVCRSIFYKNPKRSKASWERRKACSGGHASILKGRGKVFRSLTPDERFAELMAGKRFTSARVSPARFMPTSSRSITVGSLSGCAAAMCAG